MTLERYARVRVGRLLNRLEKEVQRAATERHADAVHDLRVSIRRLTQALRAFRSLLGRKRTRLVRTALREVMTIAAEIRSRDIALELFEAAKVPKDAPACRQLLKERADGSQRLLAKIRDWHRDRVCEEWRELLRTAEGTE